MADLESKDRKLAARMAALTLALGEDAPSQVKTAMESLLGGQPLARRRAFIKFYLKALSREIRQNQLVLEHAGPVTEEMIREVAVAFAARTGKKFSVVTEENPDLLGGIRVRHGDNIYDASVAGRLETLASSVR